MVPVSLIKSMILSKFFCLLLSLFALAFWRREDMPSFAEASAAKGDWGNGGDGGIWGVTAGDGFGGTMGSIFIFGSSCRDWSNWEGEVFPCKISPNEDGLGRIEGAEEIGGFDEDGGFSFARISPKELLGEVGGLISSVF